VPLLGITRGRMDGYGREGGTGTEVVRDRLLSKKAAGTSRYRTRPA
jgi:hypothetical protein